MSGKYAYDENNKRYLVLIECDFCDAIIKPGKEYINSEWTTFGLHDGFRNLIAWDLCPDCTTKQNRDRIQYRR